MNRLVFRFTNNRRGVSLSADLLSSPDHEKFEQELELRIEELVVMTALMHPEREVAAIEQLVFDAKFKDKFRRDIVDVPVEEIKDRIQALAERDEDLRAKMIETRNQIGDLYGMPRSTTDGVNADPEAGDASESVEDAAVA